MGFHVELRAKSNFKSNVRGKMRQTFVFGLITSFLWYESENVNKESWDLQNFIWFQFYVYKLCMIMCISLLHTVLN